MQKFSITAVGVLFVTAIAAAQGCILPVGISGDKNTATPHCDGTLDAFNAIGNMGGYYYDYEYSGFTGGLNGIGCGDNAKPYWNSDSGTWFSRMKNWGNNGDCATLYGCPVPKTGPPASETVYPFWGTRQVSGQPWLYYFIMDACPYTGAGYVCVGTGLGLWADGSPTTCNGAASGVDKTFHLQALSITNTSSCSTSGGNSTCTFAVTIQGPVSGAGLYGDNVAMVSGYKIYAAYGSKPPGSGAIGNWTGTSIYITYRGASSSGSFTYMWPAGSNLYLSYLPVFNNRAGTAIATLDAAGYKPSGHVPACATYAPASGITAFTAHYLDLEHAALAWTTASETGAAGFNAYRSLDGATWAQINSALIPAKGEGGSGASYNFTDHLPKQHAYQKWRYRLDEVNGAGQTLAEAEAVITK
jgi:hypothetical protein